LWRTPTIVLLGTPSSVSKECSQGYINFQNLLNLSLNTHIVGFVFHFKSATLVEVLWPRRPSDLFHRNTLAARQGSRGLDCGRGFGTEIGAAKEAVILFVLFVWLHPV
jgi:hypothetical protein